MRRRWRIGTVMLGLSTGLLLAGAEPKATEAQAKPPQPVDSMLCVGQETVESPAILGGAQTDELRAQRVVVPNCPVNFSNCVDVPGRKCTLQDCVTVDLGYHRCKKPNGQVLSCTGGTTLHQTTCDCLERLHSICCDEGNCPWGDCGICSGGSLSTVCQ